MVISMLIRKRAGCNWNAYITRDQLWAKPRPTFESRAGFHQACLMFARCLLDRVNVVFVSISNRIHLQCACHHQPACTPYREKDNCLLSSSKVKVDEKVHSEVIKKERKRKNRNELYSS